MGMLRMARTLVSIVWNVLRTLSRGSGGVKSYDTILASVEGAKFRRKIVPGDQMRIETTLLQRSRNMGKGKGVVTVDGKVATEATLSFLLVPRKTEG